MDIARPRNSSLTKTRLPVPISPHNSAQNLCTWLASSRAAHEQSSPRGLLLAAHPDDETIGASALMSRLNLVVVVFLTDGAPRDPGLRSPLALGTRESYAVMRAQEAKCALKVVGLGADRIRFLGGVDQESIFEVPRLLETLFDIVKDVRPSFIVTHPYEGGHPDHDTAALVSHLCIHLAEQRGVKAPELLEMTSYHVKEGKRVTGEFLPCKSPATEMNLNLSAAERANKARMLDCYVSQHAVLSDIPLEPERLRVAPSYEFSQPCHEGRLWYECLKWPMTGARWRELAVHALEHYGHLSCQ
jgi:N-acetylglucosamine malate deacetylase 2